MGSFTGVAAANETFLLCCWLMRANKVMLVLNPAWYSSKLALPTRGDAAQATCDTGTIRIEAVIVLLHWALLWKLCCTAMVFTTQCQRAHRWLQLL